MRKNTLSEFDFGSAGSGVAELNEWLDRTEESFLLVCTDPRDDLVSKMEPR